MFLRLFIDICLCTSGEDGRSRAEQLLHLLRQLDQYVSSPIDYQRKRGCVAVHEMLLKFRKLCVAGYCALGCSGDCPHRKYVDRSMQGNFSNLPCMKTSLKNLLFIYSIHHLLAN